MTALKVGRVTDDRQLIQDGIHEYGELTVPGVVSNFEQHS